MSSVRITGKDLFIGNGMTNLLKVNRACNIDITPLKIKKMSLLLNVRIALLFYMI